jgi:predicted site-specific integrase-resolvase
MSNPLFSISEMARRLGVAVVTLRRWDREGKLKPTLRTCGGHRRYGTVPEAPDTELTVLYARVSCHDQRPDLDRQKDRLIEFAAAKGWNETEVITDLGSGLNFKKRGLLRLLGLILERRIVRLVLENKDRLLRFGSELLFRLCAAQGIEVVIMEELPKSFEADLARDVLEIITVFSSRLYGARSSGRKRTGQRNVIDKATAVC